MLNSCAQSAQKQADIDRKYHKQYLPDIAHINYIRRSTGINSWNPQMYLCEKENYIQDAKTYTTLLHKLPEFGKLKN